MSGWDKGDVSLLSQRMARDLETVFGIGDRCRRCASFTQSYRDDVDRGRCTIKRDVVDAGGVCERFLLKYRLR